MIINYTNHNEQLTIEMLYEHGDSVDIKRTVCTFSLPITDPSELVELVVSYHNRETITKLLVSKRLVFALYQHHYWGNYCVFECSDYLILSSLYFSDRKARCYNLYNGNEIWHSDEFRDGKFFSSSKSLYFLSLPKKGVWTLSNIDFHNGNKLGDTLTFSARFQPDVLPFEKTFIVLYLRGSLFLLNMMDMQLYLSRVKFDHKGYTFQLDAISQEAQSDLVVFQFKEFLQPFPDAVYEWVKSSISVKRETLFDGLQKCENLNGKLPTSKVALASLLSKMKR